MSDVSILGASPITVTVGQTGAVSVTVNTAVPNVAWTEYEPTLNGTTSDPTLEPTNSFGYYTRLGRKVSGYVNLTFATAGSGTYSMPLPVPPVSRNQPVGTGYFVDLSNSVALYLTAAAVVPTLNADLDAVFFMGGGAQIQAGTNPANSTNPFTWAVNDSITVQFDYEAAS